jgi:hypothetical protein
MSKAKVILTSGFAALALGGTLLTPAPAEAGASTGRWRDGSYATPYGVVRPRPVYSYRSVDYGHRPYYRRHRSNVGGAVAAGVIGGLALGALASSPAYSYPAYSYPAYPVSSPGYYGAPAYTAPSCYTTTRRYVDEWGRRVTRRTQVCE